MIGRADIEGSKSSVAVNAWLPQASYPCGNFSDTSRLRSDYLQTPKGSIGHGFPVCIRTENQNQGSFYPFVQQEISVLFELPLGHLRFPIADVPPQPNSPPEAFKDEGCEGRGGGGIDVMGFPTPSIAPPLPHSLSTPEKDLSRNPPLPYLLSETTSRVVVFQDRPKESPPLDLPPILHPSCHFTTSD